MPEKNYTKRETDEYRKNMVEEMHKQSDMLREIKEDGKETKLQTQKTNGRVTKLEDKTADYSELRGLVDSFKDWKIEFTSSISGATKVIVAVMIAVPVVFGWLATLYIKDFKRTVIDESSASVVSTLQAEYNLKISK